MSVSIGGTTGVTFSDASVQNTAATGFGFKNRIINGAMVIDQRNAGASVTGTAGTVYPVDRFALQCSQASKLTVQQNAGSVTPPAGFKNYLGGTSSSAYSVLSSDYFHIYQAIEGYNVADLGWGAAGASTVTISFWVRSSLTGTFGAALSNLAASRSYPFSYTINSANTWEQKSVTIAGDTTGSWPTDNTGSFLLRFSLGAGSTYSGTANTWAAANYTQPTGSTSVVGTNAATFYITGVQLEKGSTATSFDYRPYGTELALCQRYYWKTPKTATYGLVGYDGYALSGYFFGQPFSFPVTMRSAPTGAISGTFGVLNCGQPSVIQTDSNSAYVTSIASSSSYTYFHSDANGCVTLTAEL